LGCAGYPRNHQHHTSSKRPKCWQQLHHTTMHIGCSYRSNTNATRLLTKDATCLHIKCNLFTSKLSFWQNNEQASVLTTEKVVHEGTTMTTKTSATRVFSRKRMVPMGHWIMFLPNNYWGLVIKRKNIRYQYQCDLSLKWWIICYVWYVNKVHQTGGDLVISSGIWYYCRVFLNLITLYLCYVTMII
jgi:hypothetical protein